MGVFRQRANAATPRHAALLIVFALVLTPVGTFWSAGAAKAQTPEGQSPTTSGQARLFAAAGLARAEAPEGQPWQNTVAADAENRPNIQNVLADGVATAEDVSRPEGDNVVTISPNGDGITITGSDNSEAQSEAPLWPDNPRKDDPEADPGSHKVDEAISGQQVLVVLNRPTTTREDGEEHAQQWDAWQTTYLELISNGQSFIECEIDHFVPGVEHCWVVDPTLIPGPTQAEETDNRDGEQGAAPAASTLSPEERWPGRNYQWTDPGQIDGTEFDEDANPLITIGRNHEDGSDITVVNIPGDTDDPEQRERNFDLENQTLEELDETGEPYVVCFADQTSTDINTGDTTTIPAFCTVVDPSV